MRADSLSYRLHQDQAPGHVEWSVQRMNKKPPSVTASIGSPVEQLALMRVLEQHPDYSQRQLASALGVSLGKTHYVLKALLRRGWVKAQNFQRSDRKLGYLYVMTPQGMRQRIRLTQSFLTRKQHEYETLKGQILLLQQELAAHIEESS
jgi:EPS-associated MarR family transcriptional regulator